MPSAERVARALVLPLVLAVGCGRGVATPAPPPALPEPTHYLDEPFVLSAPTGHEGARCRLLSALPTLTEPVSPPEAVPPEDLAVVDTSFACEDERGAPLPFSALAVTLSWLDAQRVAHGPYLGSKLGRAQPDHVVFELPHAGEGLRGARRYDPRTGSALSSAAHGDARLVLMPAGTARPLVLAPWSRLQDAAFDRWLDRLVLGLATAAPFDGLSDSEQGTSALVLLADLYNQALELQSPSVLVASPVTQVEGQARVTLSLLHSPAEETRGLQTASPLVGANASDLTFTLELARRADGSLSLLRLLDPVGTQDALTCARQSRELGVRLSKARVGEEARAQCNAQGLLLPGSCAQVEPALLAQALEVGARCGASAAFGLDVGGPAALPTDLEVRLRRASDLSSLAPGPREKLSLTRAGRVQFESRTTGAGGVDRGPREGRVATALVAALWDQLQQRGWQERAPVLAPTRCSADERADLISVRADGRERTLHNRAGCLGDLTSEEFEALARTIEHVAAVPAFRAPDFSDLSRDAEIWVVAAE